MDTYIDSVAGYLFMQSWQIALLAGIAGLLSLTLRHRSAHVRYLLWLIVLAKCLVPPLYSIPVAVLPDRSPISPVERLPHPVLLEAPADDSVVFEADPPARTEASVRQSESTRAAPSTNQIVVFVWLLGTFLFLFWVGIRAVRYTLWLRSRRIPLPPDLKQRFGELFSSLKLKRLPRIWLTRDIAQPFVWGLLRGSVYLPVDFTCVDVPQHHRTVLAHELGHIARFDAAINLLQVIAQTVYWFHPVVWWTNRKIRQEREKCCDEIAVAQLRMPPEHYTGAIVEALAAERRSAHPIPSLAIVGSVKDIEERIKTMMRPGKKFYKRPSLIAATIVLVLAMITVPTALVLTARAQISSAHIITSIERHNSTNAPPEIAGPLEDGALAFADREHKYQSIPPSLTGAQYIRLANDDRDIQEYELDLTLSKLTILYLFLDNRLGNGLQYNSDGSQLNPDLNKAGMGWIVNSGFVDTGLDIFINEVGAGLSKRWMSVYAKDVPAGNIRLLEQYDTSDSGLRSGRPSRNMYGIAVTDARISKAEIEAASKQKEKETQSLHKAVADRNIELVRKLIAEGADVNAKNERDMTPLEWGLFRSSLTKEVAELLIEKGANVNVLDDDGWTPLHSAIYGGADKDIVKLLVNKGADVNLTTKKGETPLHSAVEMGDIDIVRLLVDKGADFTVKNQEGWTALRSAALSGRKDMFGLFVARGTDTSSFHMAAFIGDLDRVTAFVARGTEVDTKDEAGWTALFWAACAGQQEVAEFLIDKDADIDANDGDGRSLLHQAAQAQTDAVKLVALLIAKGADINAKDSSRENTPLHLACYAGNKEVADLLIGKGADIDAKDKNGHTPLHCAALANHKAVAELLVSKGADANAENNIAATRYTPLHLAAMVDADIVEFLIDNGADVDASSGSFGRTPLHQAVITGKPRIVELLIDKGADINASDRMPGITPLAWGVRQSLPDIVELLIAKGADVNTENSLGRTVLDTAEEKGDTRIVEILQKHGAKKGSPTLLGAVESGDIEQVKLLVSQETDLNAKNVALQRACYAGKKSVVKLLIDNGADVNGFERPLLLAALARNNMELADSLLSSGADIHARTTVNGFTPLHYMGSWGRKEGAEYLLSKGADIEAKDKWGGSPLHAAIGYNKIEVVKVFLDKGADVDSKDNSDRTPLDRAEEGGRTEIVELLKRNGAKEGSTTPALRRAVTSGNIERAKLLISKGADIEAKDGNGLTLLTLVAAYSDSDNYLDMVKFLIEKGADIETRGYGDTTPLQTAVAVGRKEAAELLLARGAKLNVISKFYGTPAHQAMRQRLPDMVRWSIAKGIEIRPLHQACYYGEIDKVRSLLTGGADVNQKDIAQFTALHCAMLGQNAEIVQLLIDKGTDIEAENCADQTPLYYACERGYIEMVKLLVSNGADLNTRGGRRGELGHGSVDDWTALHIASHMGHVDVVEYLLAQGVNIHSKCKRFDDEDFTPLHLAAWNGQVDVVKVLLAKGADVDAKTDKGGTPLSLAQAQNHKAVVELLKKHRAKE